MCEIGEVAGLDAEAVSGPGKLLCREALGIVDDWCRQTW